LLAVALARVSTNGQIKQLGDSGPLFGTSLINYLAEELVLLEGPSELISTKFLHEEPSLKTLLAIFCREKDCNFDPVIILEFLNWLGFLHCIPENTPL
jgi:hypothetical protein